jgi:hypothetical protein
MKLNSGSIHHSHRITHSGIAFTRAKQIGGTGTQDITGITVDYKCILDGGMELHITQVTIHNLNKSGPQSADTVPVDIPVAGWAGSGDKPSAHVGNTHREE